MIRKLSTYWKCQLTGWMSFALVTYVFNVIIYGDPIDFLLKALILSSFGLFFSHGLKLIIKKAGILNKKFAWQIVYLSLLVIAAAVLSTFCWLTVVVKTGIWKVNVLKNIEPNVYFYQVYFYHLFIVLLILSGWVLIYFLFHYVRGIRKEEQFKAEYQVQILELEARALRAQMNPHFIFNCMNSIKALIQKDENEKAINYLTTFSKLIRTIFQNSDKREITLHDEIETCRLYTALESMRFGNKLNFEFDIDETLDLKSVMVPALIVQPFIENAIWHGIMPKEDGGKLTIRVSKKDHTINCMIEDDGIGREVSKQNKFSSAEPMHQSKGEHLTHARLNLDNLLNERNAKIEITDKKNGTDQTEGTTVILSFSEDQ